MPRSGSFYDPEEYEGFEDDDEAYEDDDEAFEDDDEAIEDDDEAFEDDDEAYEDDDEAFEDDDEAFEDDDEAYEDDDEAFEDDDEAVEDDDEAVEDTGLISAAERRRRSRRSRNRFLRAQRRAALRARRLRMSSLFRQRQAKRRAMAIQKRIRQRMRKIRGPGRVKVRSLGKAKQISRVKATLRNGRQAEMKLWPPVASATDVAKLKRAISENDKRQARALSTLNQAVKKLKNAESTMTKTMMAQQLKLDKELSKRITDGDVKLDKRISKELARQKDADRTQRNQIKRAIRKQQQRSMWNNILFASAVPFAAAYGKKADLLAYENIAIASSTALCSVGDEIIDRFLAESGKRSQIWGKGASTWSIAAPFVNAGILYWLLNDRQHERFITGVDTIKLESGAWKKTVDIKNKVGEDYKKDFEGFENVRAYATIKQINGTAAGTTPPADGDGNANGGTGGTTSTSGINVIAKVDAGVLTLELGGALSGVTSVDVYYAVDTKKPESNGS